MTIDQIMSGFISLYTLVNVVLFVLQCLTLCCSILMLSVVHVPPVVYIMLHSCNIIYSEV